MRQRRKKELQEKQRKSENKPERLQCWEIFVAKNKAHQV
jgi:hypothetical protein